MIITIRYGDNKKVILNPICKNNILLEHIKERCDCSHDDIVELSDEKGNVKFLNRNLTEYGSDYMTDREVLVLLRVEHEDDRVTYTPMLKALADDTEFIAKLNPVESQRVRRGRKGSNNPIRGSEDDPRKAMQRRSSKGSLVSRRKSLTQTPRVIAKMASTSGVKLPK